MFSFKSYVVIALALFTLATVRVTHAADITVDETAFPGSNNNGQCSLFEALRNANADRQLHTDCPAGTGDDIITINDGLYLIGNLGVADFDHATIIQGASQEGVILVPARPDARLDGETYKPDLPGYPRIAFNILSSNVTIRNLTIDGAANPNLDGSSHFRVGVQVRENVGNFALDNTVIRNIYWRGIQFLPDEFSSSFQQVSNNTFENIERSAAIAIFDNTVVNIDDNTISTSAQGIFSTWVAGPDAGPTAYIRGNSYTNPPQTGGQAMLLTGLNGVSRIGSTDPEDGNLIDLSGGSDMDSGIIITYAHHIGSTVNDAITIQNNRITAGEDDVGIWLFHNENAGLPVLVLDNELRGSATNAATGILLTDDGIPLGDEDGASYGIVVGNTISGFARGIHLLRQGTRPNGGRSVTATITNNEIMDNAVGIQVSGSTTREDNPAIANINNNVIAGSIRAGIIVDADATLSPANIGNCLLNNTIGVINETEEPINLTGNWWGSDTGPSGAGTGSGDGISEEIDYVPVLVSPPAMCSDN